jgi:hypothetical protein
MQASRASGVRILYSAVDIYLYLIAGNADEGAMMLDNVQSSTWLNLPDLAEMLVRCGILGNTKYLHYIRGACSAAALQCVGGVCMGARA